MFTSIDKALVALIMGLLFIASSVFGFTIPGWLNEQQINTIVGLLTPVLVWAIPNRSPLPK